MEFSLGYNKSWGDFSWNSNLTFSFNKNKIVELLDDAVDDEGNHYSLSEIDKGGTLDRLKLFFVKEEAWETCMSLIV